MRFLEENKKFNWDYSFHEIGIYDIPACIDYILNISKQSQKLILCGHSFGASAILAGISIFAGKAKDIEDVKKRKVEQYDEENEEESEDGKKKKKEKEGKMNPKIYEEKVLTTILISPITEFQNMPRSFKQYLEAINIEEILAETPQNEKPLLFHDSQKAHFTTKFYNVFPLKRHIECCMNAENTKWTESPTTYKTYFAKYPNGTCRRYVEHIKQIIATGKFVKFTENFDYKKYNEKIENNVNKENNENAENKENENNKNKDSKNIKNNAEGKNNINQNHAPKKDIINNDSNNKSNSNNSYSNMNHLNEYDFESFANIPSILIYGQADQLNTYVYEQTKIIEQLAKNENHEFFDFGKMGHYCFLLNNDLSWVNFLLKALQKQISNLEKVGYDTYNSEIEDISYNQAMNKSSVFNIGGGNNQGGMEANIN